MKEIGFDDLSVLVINDMNHDGFITELEEYSLPVLQDTAQEDVFGRFGARGYDIFLLDRHGFIEAAMPDTFPIEEHDLLVEALLRAR